jgi:hypothetical protein
MREMKRINIVAATLFVVLNIGQAVAAPAEDKPRAWFNRYATHWGELDDDFIKYVLDVRPQVVQAGFFGPGYYAARAIALAEGKAEHWTSFGGGVVDLGWWRDFITRAHAGGIRVQGMSSITLLTGDSETGLGFFDYFDNRWDTALLGPKPPVKAVDLMQIKAEGELISEPAEPGYRLYFGCPANPHWRTVLKAFVKVGIDLGLDGFAVLLAHRRECICEHCQRGFRRFLGERYNARELRERFGISDLGKHRFGTINGFYMPEETGPLSLECLKFGQYMLYECEREVFVEYGRSLKPDLLLGQWNHLYCYFCSPWHETFSQLNGDERCTLPSELWARGEDWVMYSIGNSSGYWRPDEDQFGQFSLEHKYLKEAGSGRPQSIKVDDGTRVRLYTAEAVAHGGFAYARGPGYRDPATRRIVKTYFDFLREHEGLYRAAKSYAEVGVVFPRRSVHRGDVAGVAAFKRAGLRLSREHFLFDVVLDTNVNATRLRRYRALLFPENTELTPSQSQALEAWEKAGGELYPVPLEPEAALNALANDELPFSTITAPPTVLWTAWRHSSRPQLVVHFVNYARDAEKAVDKTAAAAECPAPAGALSVRFVLPERATARSVTLLSPDAPGTKQEVSFEQVERTLNFRVEQVITYGLCVVDLGD